MTRGWVGSCQTKGAQHRQQNWQCTCVTDTPCADRLTVGQADRHTHTHSSHRQTDRQTDGHTDRQTGRQTNRRTDSRQTGLTLIRGGLGLTEPMDLFSRLHCLLRAASAVMSAPLTPRTLAAAAEEAFRVCSPASRSRRQQATV